MDEAYDSVRDILTVWREVARWPDAPPFPGGVFEDWPRRISRGLAFLRAESKAVESYLQHQQGVSHG